MIRIDLLIYVVCNWIDCFAKFDVIIFVQLILNYNALSESSMSEVMIKLIKLTLYTNVEIFVGVLKQHINKLLHVFVINH